jgi:molybdopterin converting factor small subunit
MVNQNRWVTVRLFGAFRGLAGGSAGAVRVELSEGARVSDVKAALARALPGSGDLLVESVLASEHGTLSETDPVGQWESLAVLPPVCGG